MGKVITINIKKQFKDDLSDVVKTKTLVKIDGIKHEVETTIYPLGTTVGAYNKYKIQFYKKYNVTGEVFGKQFSSILRKYETEVLVSDSRKYVFTIGSVKGIVPRAAFKRLAKDTEVKCQGINVDLLKAIPLIIENTSNITINSGWFSNLGTSLKNAWLQGTSVNENPDWQKFVRTKGSKLKNVELRIEDDYFEKGYIYLSLSARGFLFTNSAIKDSKYIAIAEDIVNLVKEAIKNDDENVEEEIDEIEGIEKEIEDAELIKENIE